MLTDETEMRSRLEEERTKLQMLQADKEVKVAAARMKVYNNCESDLEDEEERGNVTRSGWREAENKSQLKPHVKSFHSQQVFQDVRTTQETGETENLAQVLANSCKLIYLSQNRQLSLVIL